MKDLLAQIEQSLLSCPADGAYDKRKVYDALHAHSPEAEILIPSRKNAHIWQHGNSKEERLKRDENLRYIRKHGRAQSEEDSGYHVRSLAETSLFRLKTIFGDKLSARLLETQTTQALIRCLALNQIIPWHAGKLSSCLILTSRQLDCAYSSIYAPMPKGFDNMKRGIDYIGVGVGAIITHEEGRIFLARRGPAANNEQGLWEFPGGSVEFGETLAEALQREMYQWRSGIREPGPCSARGLTR